MEEKALRDMTRAIDKGDAAQEGGGHACDDDAGYDRGRMRCATQHRRDRQHCTGHTPPQNTTWRIGNRTRREGIVDNQKRRCNEQRSGEQRHTRDGTYQRQGSRPHETNEDAKRRIATADRRICTTTTDEHQPPGAEDYARRGTLPQTTSSGTQHHHTCMPQRHEQTDAARTFTTSTMARRARRRKHQPRGPKTRVIMATTYPMYDDLDDEPAQL